jgi:hypothetical protein
VDNLAVRHPEFKAFIGSIRNSISFYGDESSKTLFVSNFVVYNIPSLLEMHPQNDTKYYTEIYMVEHNTKDEEVQEVLEKMLAGEPQNEPNEEPVSENIELAEAVSELPVSENIAQSSEIDDIADDDEDGDGDGELTIDFEEFN